MEDHYRMGLRQAAIVEEDSAPELVLHPMLDEKIDCESQRQRIKAVMGYARGLRPGTPVAVSRQSLSNVRSSRIGTIAVKCQVKSRLKHVSVIP